MEEGEAGGAAEQAEDKVADADDDDGTTPQGRAVLTVASNLSSSSPPI